MHSRIAALITSVLLLTLLVASVIGQRQSPYLTKSRPVNLKTHGLTGRVVGNLGGVLSSADRLVDPVGDPVLISVEHESLHGYPGYVTVRRTEPDSESTYRIDYASLVPIAMFVDSGATSLFTVVGDSIDAQRFVHDAGLVPHPGGGYVALEFGGTPYATALEVLDLCDTTCLGSDVIGFLRKLDVGYVRRVVPWINTDAGLTSPRPYAFALQDGTAHISGGLVRFYLSRSRPFGTVVIDSAREILEAPDGEVAEAHFLFETLVLLRAAKNASPVLWASFLTSLSAEPLVRAHPEPWKLYTQNFCSVYPDMPDFFDCDGW